jgi:hypothetical protein
MVRWRSRQLHSHQPHLHLNQCFRGMAGLHCLLSLQQRLSPDQDGLYHEIEAQGLKSITSIYLAFGLKPINDSCCSNPDHPQNYRSGGNLPKPGASISAPKDYVRDTLYTRHTSNFRVLRPSKILGIGQRKAELPMRTPASWQLSRDLTRFIRLQRPTE